MTIPSSVKTIGMCAFGSCNNLSSIHAYPISPIDLNSSISVFGGINKNTCTLYVPFGSKAAYQTANQWKDFTNIVEMPGFKLSATTVNIKALKGSTSKIDISSDVACKIISSQPWLVITPSVESGSNSITFTAEENPNNTTRTSIVTISSIGVDTQTITVTQEAKLNTGIDQISITPGFRVYPNPTSGKVKLVFEKVPLNGINITIDDITGKSCLKQLIHEKEMLIDLSGNVPGIYFLKTDQKDFKAQKVVLK